eukprot:8826099-Alexandrium_andersonii.AAC.1
MAGPYRHSGWPVACDGTPDGSLLQRLMPEPDPRTLQTQAKPRWQEWPEPPGGHDGRMWQCVIFPPPPALQSKG